MNDMKRQGGSEAPATDYHKEKIALARERAAREAALHELHTENLKLQNQTLKAQRSQLHTQRLHDRFRAIYQSVLSVVALAVLAVIVYAIVSAARDQSVVVNQFQVPPDMAAQGNSGTVVASSFLDDLQVLQAASRSSQAALALEDAWSSNIQLQVPDVHVSLGDIRHTLHQWLGHEIQITGNVVEQGSEIALTVRGTSFAAKSFTGTPAELPKLVNSAAEYVYGKAEPYLFATYLELNGRDNEAIPLIKDAWTKAPAAQKPWLLNAWGNALGDLNQNMAAVNKYEQAIRLNPHFWMAYSNLIDTQLSLGNEQGAYHTGLLMEQEARRGHWFAAKVNVVQYQPMDFLRMDLPLAHRDLMVDEAAHGGVGSLVGADPPLDAEMLVRMHADSQANLILQTTPGIGSDPYVMAESAFVQGIMMLGQPNYAQAVVDFQQTQAVLAKNPNQLANFTEPTVCYLGLALGISGQTAAGLSDIAQGGHFVDCYRFKGDIDDHTGNWVQAQQDYVAAVQVAPSLPQAYESWGEALARHGIYKDAIMKFAAANQRGPHWCDPLEHWGEALAAEGNYKSAIEKYTEAAQYTSGWAGLELHWGEALDKLGHHSEAQQHYQLAQQYRENLTATQHAELAKLLKT